MFANVLYLIGPLGHFPPRYERLSIKSGKRPGRGMLAAGKASRFSVRFQEPPVSIASCRYWR
jgi:hypothetical protein